MLEHTTAIAQVNARNNTGTPINGGIEGQMEVSTVINEDTFPELLAAFNVEPAMLQNLIVEVGVRLLLDTIENTMGEGELVSEMQVPIPFGVLYGAHLMMKEVNVSN